MFISLSLALVALFSLLTYNEYALATSNYNPNDFDELEDLPGWGEDINIQRSSTLTQKSRKEGSQRESESSTFKKQPYHSKHALSSYVDPIMTDFLRTIESHLINKGNYEWEDWDKLTEEAANQICDKIWKIISVRDISVDDATMKSTCFTNKLAGPSNKGHSYKYYKVYYQCLLISEPGNSFRPDLLRCDCAYVAFNKGARAIDFTKRFFFLYKDNENTYLLLSIIGDAKDRALRVIDALRIQ